MSIGTYSTLTLYSCPRQAVMKSNGKIVDKNKVTIKLFRSGRMQGVCDIAGIGERNV